MTHLRRSTGPMRTILTTIMVTEDRAIGSNRRLVYRRNLAVCAGQDLITATSGIRDTSSISESSSYTAGSAEVPIPVQRLGVALPDRVSRPCNDGGPVR